MTETILVTGGAGFIGSALVSQLNGQGVDRIVVADEWGTDERWKNLVGKRFVDFVDKGRLFDWLKGNDVSACIHLGACSSTVETNASYLFDNNTYFSQRLADHMLSRNIRFIYASSAATYGDGSLGFSDSHDALYELKPLNMYGYSKHLFDLWLLQNGGLKQAVGLKYFNVFGPNEYHKGRMASAVYHMFHEAERTGAVRLFRSNDERFPDGGQMRDFIYVKDAVRMTAAFLENRAAGLFNIGRGLAGTWNEVAEALFTGLDRKVEIVYFDMPGDLVGKYQNYTLADMGKAKQALGSSVDCAPLEESIVDYVRNYLMTGAYL